MNRSRLIVAVGWDNNGAKMEQNQKKEKDGWLTGWLRKWINFFFFFLSLNLIETRPLYSPHNTTQNQEYKQLNFRNQLRGIKDKRENIYESKKRKPAHISNFGITYLLLPFFSSSSSSMPFAITENINDAYIQIYSFIHTYNYTYLHTIIHTFIHTVTYINICASCISFLCFSPVLVCRVSLFHSFILY